MPNTSSGSNTARSVGTTGVAFPLNGINVVSSRAGQPPGTCVNCLNVRAFDNLEDRARGGIRPGLSNYLANTFAGAGRIQDLNYSTIIRDAPPNTASLYIRDVKAVAVSNGVIQQFNTAEIVPAQQTGTATLSANSSFIMSTELFGKIFYCDGLDYKVWVGSTGDDEVQSLSANSASGGTFTLTVVLPPGNAGDTATTANIAYDAAAAAIQTSIDTAMAAKTINGVAYSAGDITVAGGPAHTTPTTFTYDGTSATNKNWGIMTVDGALLTGGGPGTITTTTPGAGNIAEDWTTVSPLPGNPGSTVANTAGRLIESWDGRVVISGLRTDPHNYFMAAKGDPDDFDYAPANTTELQAVTGGVGVVGKIPDIINSMIPYSDDILIFGCDHSIYQMSGNPMSGGRIDNVSTRIGMPFGRPWCKDPEGNVYFFSSLGDVYRMPPYGAKPAKISDAVHPLLKTTDLNTHSVRMEWDDEAEGCKLWLTPFTEGSATHWFWESRTNAWFPDTYANTAYNPIAVMLYDGDQQNDRVVLQGSEDGKVRFMNTSAIKDNGNDFMSTVTLGPFFGGEGHVVRQVITGIQARTDPNGNATKYEILQGDTPELAQNAEAATFIGDGTFSAGFSLRDNPMAGGYFSYVKFGTATATKAWALEVLDLTFEAVTTDPGRLGT